MTTFAYQINRNADLCYDPIRNLSLDIESIITTVNEFNTVADKIWSNLTEAWVYGLRMPDSVSDIIANTLVSLSNKSFMRNPDEKGFPDLIPLHEGTQEFIKNHSGSRNSIYKNFGSLDGHSPSIVPGVEVKATLVASPENKQERKLVRVKKSISPKWLSHYPTTVNLLAIAWDFTETGTPFIVGVWFVKLEPSDWTEKTDQPSERTTPRVSTATKSAKEKFNKGLVMLIEDQRYADALKNFGAIINPAIGTVAIDESPFTAPEVPQIMKESNEEDDIVEIDSVINVIPSSP